MVFQNNSIFHFFPMTSEEKMDFVIQMLQEQQKQISSLGEEIKNLRTELKADIAELKTDMKN
mgnify:CR=1 FL=1